MAENVTDLQWMKELLADEEVGHLALADGDCPYVVPINYAYINDKIVIHCAMQGKKLDIIRKNACCCLAVNRHPDRVKYHAEKRCHYRYQSVIAYGKARFVESADERLKWIKRYLRYFNDRHAWIIPDKEDIKTAENCGIILVDVEEMTGRCVECSDEKASMILEKTEK